MKTDRLMLRPLTRRVVAALTAAVMLGALAGQGAVLAADPTPSITPNNGDLVVGISRGTAGMTPEQLGYTQAYVDWKEAQAAALMAAVHSAGAMSPATTGYLNGYVQYHQKTTSWCLAAVMQTILRFKQGSTWTTPSVLSKQTDIYNQIGTSESAALPWINAKLSGFQYVAIEPKPVLATFTSHIVADVTTFVYPTYVAVNVGNSNYVWYQDGTARHASAALGYSSSGAYVRIGDPFTSPDYSPGCTTGAHNPGYSSTPDIGCVYGAWDMSKYQSAAYAMWW
jgi:hypothetical protein